MSSVQVAVTASNVVVSAPYNPDFAPRAKRLGGRWNPSGKTWGFDARDEARVRDLCRDVYGTDGSPEELCTVRVKLSAQSCSSLAFFAFGRQLARAFGRDSGARLSDGVVLLSGSIGSGGSMKNPVIATKGCVVEVRDVPVRAVRKACWEDDVGVHVDSVEIVEDVAASTVDRVALVAERERLQARLAEISSILGEEVSQ